MIFYGLCKGIYHDIPQFNYATTYIYILYILLVVVMFDDIMLTL